MKGVTGSSPVGEPKRKDHAKHGLFLPPISRKQILLSISAGRNSESARKHLTKVKFIIKSQCLGDRNNFHIRVIQKESFRFLQFMMNNKIVNRCVIITLKNNFNASFADAKMIGDFPIGQDVVGRNYVVVDRLCH